MNKENSFNPKSLRGPFSENFFGAKRSLTFEPFATVQDTSKITDKTFTEILKKQRLLVTDEISPLRQLATSEPSTKRPRIPLAEICEEEISETDDYSTKDDMICSPVQMTTLSTPSKKRSPSLKPSPMALLGTQRTPGKVPWTPSVGLLLKARRNSKSELARAEALIENNHLYGRTFYIQEIVSDHSLVVLDCVSEIDCDDRDQVCIPVDHFVHQYEANGGGKKKRITIYPPFFFISGRIFNPLFRLS